MKIVNKFSETTLLPTDSDANIFTLNNFTGLVPKYLWIGLVIIQPIWQNKFIEYYTADKKISWPVAE